MALESVVFRQNPFNHGYDFDINIESTNQHVIINQHLDIISAEDQDQSINTKRDFSPETCRCPEYGRKRRRTRSLKNKEEMENQRMTHIAVERNRRRLMNEYLSVLRSLMPPSYAQRGDQASIVGGAINFVKELEQQVHFLEGQKQTNRAISPPLFSNFFTFPQYSSSKSSTIIVNGAAECRPIVADIEVTMVESHANIKVLSKRRPKQLVKMVAGFHSICLTILHLNVTTMDQSVLYSFNVKVEEECQLNTVNEIATAVHEMVGLIQQEPIYA